MATTRRLAAILAADVAGYSRLMGADEEGTHERLQAHFAELVHPKIAEHRGRVVKNTGDGLLAEFASVVDAVRCAVEMQRGMAERNAGIAAPERIEFRIGINLGDVIVEQEEIFGDGVNVAARLESLADPGGICVSQIVRDQVRDRLDQAIHDLGEQQVKNIARPVHVYRILVGVLAQPTGSGPAAKQSLAVPDKPSIAVLPFQNMSGDPEQEYFADGMVEEIITALSKVRWFLVIARNSSFSYKGRIIDAKQVGRELGVRYLLEGSVRKSGSRVRISAQLIDAATGTHVWAERYDRELADVFAVQDEITERVVAAMEPQLYAAEYFRSQRKPPESLDAWECVIRALSSLGQGTAAGTAEAEALCRRAIAIAPGYAQAHSLLAWVLVRGVAAAGGDIRTVLPEANAEARTALASDERDPWAHMTQGVVLWRTRRHVEAERAFRRALELNPNFALAHACLGLPLAVRGERGEAIKSAQYALLLSPNDRIVGARAAEALAAAYFGDANYADGAAWARIAIESGPGVQQPHRLLVAAAAMAGDMSAAAEALATLLRLQPNLSLAWASENTAYTGDMAERFIAGLRKAGIPEG
ncbi:MAG: tetratricopeptide repeat protein [Alphaproteobacteria bacterium]|nr:tetratricopeptide repeat protein [Alphaproteobacteria bacterium]